MPRLQVYLPDDLFEAVKTHELPASKLLQGAVRTELREREASEEARRYAAALIEHFGEPSAEDCAWAEKLSQDVRRAEARSLDSGLGAAPLTDSRSDDVDGLAAGL